MNTGITEIARELRKRYLDESSEQNQISIFLCGGKKEEGFRRKVGKQISNVISKYVYTVHFPEDMFIELIQGHEKQDLLSLENLLADSVNAIVVLLQSPGTFTELGAFSNYSKLKDKLIVNVDPKYSRANSFINYGPIRYLKNNTNSRILYIKMIEERIVELVKAIIFNAREIAKATPVKKNITNPIAAYQFYLALIYVLDPMPRNAVGKITEMLCQKKNNQIDNIIKAVIHSLINERKIVFNSGCLSTTSLGNESLLFGNHKNVVDNRKFLAALRIQAMNILFRGKGDRAWGGIELD